MPPEILYRETYGEDGPENVFVKSKDGIVPRKKESSNEFAPKLHLVTFIALFKDVFLPRGYPSTVHPDYIWYQIWDTIQAFASTITGALATHTVLQGIGVGESSATPLSAAISWILRDGTGMTGHILFAWWNGHGFDSQCKKWRLFADVLNDVAMGIELLLPYCLSYSWIILCMSAVMRSLVGAAGSATRASITEHQALENNLADLAAKDGSQEVLVNLIGSFVGIWVLSNFAGGSYVIHLFVLLAMIHQYANYRAVKALNFKTLNEDRLSFIVKQYLISQTVPSVNETNHAESVLLHRDPTKKLFGFRIRMGVSLGTLLKSDLIKREDIEVLSDVFENRGYLIVLDARRKTILVPLAIDVTSSQILQAYFHACIYALTTYMQRREPHNILVRAKSHLPSYTLTRMHLLVKKYPSSFEKNISTGISVDMYLAIDQLVSTEYKLFEESLENMEWSTVTSLLPIEQWRGSWGIKKTL